MQIRELGKIVACSGSHGNPLFLGGKEFQVGSIPQPAMGTSKDYCRYIKAPSTPYLRAIPVPEIDRPCVF